VADPRVEADADEIGNEKTQDSQNQAEDVENEVAKDQDGY
jgi:hypothetical protein